MAIITDAIGSGDSIANLNGLLSEHVVGRWSVIGLDISRNSVTISH